MDTAASQTQGLGTEFPGCPSHLGQGGHLAPIGLQLIQGPGSTQGLSPSSRSRGVAEVGNRDWWATFPISKCTVLEWGAVPRILGCSEHHRAHPAAFYREGQIVPLATHREGRAAIEAGERWAGVSSPGERCDGVKWLWWAAGGHKQAQGRCLVAVWAE